MPDFHAKKRRFLHDAWQKFSVRQTFIAKKDTIATAGVS
jgi:hypothetical protein